MGNWIPKCMSTMITTVMSTYFAPAPAFDEKPLLFDVKLLQRYQRLREKGKFLDLEIKCSDGSTRFVHKFVLNSLSVKLGRAIQESKYIPHIYQFIFRYVAYRMVSIFFRESLLFTSHCFYCNSHIKGKLWFHWQKLANTDSVMPKRKHFFEIHHWMF